MFTSIKTDNCHAILTLSFLLFILQCLSSVTTALGLGFEQYAPPVFERCLKLIESTLYQSQLCQQNPTLDLPEKEFMIVALDLLSGLAQGLGSHIDPLVANSNPSLINMLGFCIVVSSVGDGVVNITGRMRRIGRGCKR